MRLVRAALALTAQLFLFVPAIAQQTPKTFKDCNECPQMVVVPAGGFKMGSMEGPSVEIINLRNPPPDKYTVFPERPVRAVRIKEFAIGQYPVTRGEFAAFVRETVDNPAGCNFTPGKWFDTVKERGWRDPGYPQTDQHPVVCVGRADIKLYLQWLNRKTGKTYRLPTEAEWEYAARGGTTTDTYWGSDPKRACEFGNIADLTGAPALTYFMKASSAAPCRDGYVYTSPVGSFHPNAFGLHDMLGNVRQHVEDCKHRDYTGAPSDGSAWTTSCDDESHHMVRGASWATLLRFARSARRDDVYTSYERQGDIGFRVVVALDEARTTTPVTNCAEAELHWKSIEEIKTRAGYEAHIARYPDCPFATLARARLQAMQNP